VADHTKKPNIVLILADDLGWTDLGCYGSSFYETPNIDRLGASGLQFTNAYASCPVCSPTRASIMTGKYPARLGITNFIYGQAEGRLAAVPFLDHLPLSERSLAKALREADYQTWHVGKWHLGGREFEPQNHGFDVNVGGGHIGLPKQGYFSPWGLDNLEDGPEGEYLTDRLTDEALRLIETRNTDRAFFLNMCHYAVHTPIEAPEALVEKYRRKRAQLGLESVKEFEEGESFPTVHKKDKRVRRRLVQSDPVYAAMVENLDTNIGRLIEAVAKAGELENTFFIFTSDNGGLSTAEGSPTCNKPLSEGKGWMYDGGTRVCLLASRPGVIEPGRTSRVPVTSTDLYPTILEAAGLALDPAQHPDGESLTAVLRDDSDFDRGPLFWHYPHYSNQGGTPGCSIREGAYVLIKFFEDWHAELYNIEDDVEQKHDLAEAMPEKTSELRAKLTMWRESIEAKIPEPNPDGARELERAGRNGEAFDSPYI
jgi:arylsulfatase A-like enzyme